MNRIWKWLQSHVGLLCVCFAQLNPYILSLSDGNLSKTVTVYRK